MRGPDTWRRNGTAIDVLEERGWRVRQDARRQSLEALPAVDRRLLGEKDLRDAPDEGARGRADPGDRFPAQAAAWSVRQGEARQRVPLAAERAGLHRQVHRDGD